MKIKYLMPVLLIVFIFSLIGCRAATAETTAAATTAAQETVPPTTVAETVPPTTETTPETTAEVIFNAPVIDGLRFDKETRTYFAEKGNPYGLEVGAEAGVYTPNILTTETIDGTPGNFDKGVVSLPQEVIEVLQAKILKEKGELFLPLMVDTRGISSLGLMELKDPLDTRVNPVVRTKYLGMTVPMGTNIYSLFDGDLRFPFDPDPNVDNTYKEYFIQKVFEDKDKFYFFMNVRRGNLFLENKKFEVTSTKINDKVEIFNKLIHVDYGELIGKIISEEPLSPMKASNQIEDKGEHQLLLQIYGDDREEYLGGFVSMLTVGNTLVSFLPKEAK